MGQDPQATAQVASGLRLGQRLDQARQRPVVDAPAALRGSDRQADGEVGLADARETSDILPVNRVA